jgi:hypothetical protein
VPDEGGKRIYTGRREKEVVSCWSETARGVGAKLQEAPQVKIYDNYHTFYDFS